MNEAFRQYAVDWGIARVGRLFKELEVPLTIVLNAEFPERHASVWKEFRASQPNAPIVALVKPQFEAGRGRTDHGVVRDPAIHSEVLEKMVAVAQALGLGARDVIASPILGPEGNREFLLHLQSGPGCSEIGDRIREVTGA